MSETRERARRELVDEVVESADRGAASVEVALGKLLGALRQPLGVEDSRRLLRALRGGRHFSELARAAESLQTAGDREAHVLLQHAQALIELGQTHPAERVLRGVLEEDGRVGRDPTARSEALGLLGRIHKQRFVAMPDHSEAGRRELKASFDAYREAYELDPEWHGANMVALARRAERDGAPVVSGVRASELARTLLAELARSSGAWSPWRHAGAAEAHLALDDWGSAVGHYSKFARHPKVDGFAIGSATRQLREVWGAEVGRADKPSMILAVLEARTLTTGTGRGGTLATSADGLAHLGKVLRGASAEIPDPTFEAILGDNPLVPIRSILGLLDVARSVGQLVDRNQYDRHRPSGGTGFLVDGVVYRPEWRGRPLFVTNNHVLNEIGYPPGVCVADADVIFHFWGGRPVQRRLKIAEIVDGSGPRQGDFTIATLCCDESELLPRALPEWDTSPRSLQPPGTQPPDRVFVVGHPQGRGLEFSVSDNEVIDHQVHDSDASVPTARRIHYRAPTEKGSSGSPVISERTAKVLALHCRGGKDGAVRPLHGGDDRTYDANEAVWCGSISPRFA